MTDLPTHVILIAKHFGVRSGGEAIKAFHFAHVLRDRGIAVTVATHDRALSAQGGEEIAVDFLVVPDGRVQEIISWLKPIRGLLDVHFHLVVRRMILRNIRRDPGVLLHYVGPISPVMPRFLPRGYDIVLGPLSGNIFYPPAFRSRAPVRYRLSEKLHALVQRGMGLVFPEKRRARVVLVSGYERTRASLRLAGVREAQMVDVVDSGVNDRITAWPRIEHDGRNGRFVCIGRMIDYKGHDLAIRALARTGPEISLDIYGDGETRPKLEALVRELDVGSRVRFLGWADNDSLMEAFRAYRGLVFPTLSEANGIVMQEAMMLGLPTIVTRWGGPEGLADESSALYVDPLSEEHMVSEIAGHMVRLAGDAGLAEGISRASRAIAEARFSWDAVSESWIRAAYVPEARPAPA